ncbi:MAG: hypothetical protein ACXWK9_07930, partial [Myxococcaceae bacterium]
MGGWRGAVTVAFLAMLGGSGCLDVGADSACGASGQSCCKGASCNPELVCGSGERCSAPATFTVGGTVDGLTGLELILRNNGGDPLGVITAGAFTFPTAVQNGRPYSVTVSSQPSGQTCTVWGGAGVLRGGNVADVRITCKNDPVATYSVGGLLTGLVGSGLVLQNKGGDNLSIASNGSFSFATRLGTGNRYDVTVLLRPIGQTCTVGAGSGVVADAPVTTVVIRCVSDTAPRYTIGGTVSGLVGAGLVLRNNGADALSIGQNGPFTFVTPLPAGAKYAVTVSTQPTLPSQTCSVTRGSGSLGSGRVTDVVVTCVTNLTPKYTVGGTVTGLNGTGLVLENNGADDL